MTFKQILKTLTFAEIIKGFSITLKWLGRANITEEYPDDMPELPYRFRGRLHVDIDKCISCCACETACPDQCIKVYAPPKDQFKLDKRPLEFLLNLEHCMWCGLCVDPCPTGAIHHSQEFEMAVFDRGELNFTKETLPYDLEVAKYGKHDKNLDSGTVEPIAPPPEMEH